MDDMPALDQLLDYRARLLERLEQQPGEYAALIAAIPEPEWLTRRDPQGRSLHHVVAHIRDLETQAFLPRVRRILAEDGPLLAPFPDHRWTDATYRADEPMARVLTEWSTARAELMQALRPLPNSAWSRVGFHPPSGSRTLQWWVERIHRHAREHFEAVRGIREGV